MLKVRLMGTKNDIGADAGFFFIRPYGGVSGGAGRHGVRTGASRSFVQWHESSKYGSAGYGRYAGTG